MAKEKITYLLGAGASIGSFPLVKKTDQWKDLNLADCLSRCGKDLQNRIPNLWFDSTKYSETAIQLSKDLQDLALNAQSFGNVDSYAKYLYHTRQAEKLNKLKVSLAYYFCREQLFSITKPGEIRYLNFITSLITPKHTFPEEVKILTWNYDFLLEQAIMLYGSEKFSENAKVAVRTPPFADYYPHHGYEFNLTHKDYVSKDFAAIHLNGIAGFYLEKNENGNGVFKSIFNDSTNKKWDEQKAIDCIS